ncbi:NUDIX hydrolase [Bifidobacterium sp. ESL0800]|uniref:NUDIX hydrolase n=1 Tax=Bifidobacterium sp. ESL0800 TaxID=2983236 RepID=UPI0023F973F1|nr:NUDIX hydrolase [Bifidobacterium sp. ESL0800]WEV76461.1 NUDIX hydrolase [Bifidobacterium sp. ESL0800]
MGSTESAESAESTRTERIQEEVSRRLQASSDGVDMETPVRMLSSETVYRGAIFHIDDRKLALAGTDGGKVTVRRQILVHPQAVVMLVHDELTDRYLLEREYRVGPNKFAYGFPAGLMEEGEEPETSALRELQEETGVTPKNRQSVRIEHVGNFYSSGGMTNELAHIFVLHLSAWKQKPRHFDKDEHVQSAWVTWEELTGIGIQAADSTIAIQHEEIRRLREQLTTKE